ncbi:hypothetical protein D3C81_1646920 [compost metagenome]
MVSMQRVSARCLDDFGHGLFCGDSDYFQSVYRSAGLYSGEMGDLQLLAGYILDSATHVGRFLYV